MLTNTHQNIGLELKSEDRTSQNKDSIFPLLYSIFKKICIVGGVYLVGYMGWSIAWLITPIVLAVTREYFQNAAEQRRSFAKSMAKANEKDLIMSRITDLPAWV